MIILIEGKEHSGKSEYAEMLFEEIEANGYYIATMIPYGDFGKEKIEKHLKQRAHLNLITIEDPFLINEEEIPENSVVILEDISNLVANYIFEKKLGEDSIKEALNNLFSKCKKAYVVGMKNLDASDYDEETKNYIISMNNIMDYIENKAKVVIKMQDNSPVYIKGCKDDII